MAVSTPPPASTAHVRGGRERQKRRRRRRSRPPLPPPPLPLPLATAAASPARIHHRRSRPSTKLAPPPRGPLESSPAAVFSPAAPPYHHQLKVRSRSTASRRPCPPLSSLTTHIAVLVPSASGTFTTWHDSSTRWWPPRKIDPNKLVGEKIKKMTEISFEELLYRAGQREEREILRTVRAQVRR